MASCRGIKTVEQDAGRDLISQLPAEIKDKILEFLPTRDAARTALLSSHWKDVWLRHGQLVFDSNFFRSLKKYKSDHSKHIVNIIDTILLLHIGPVKKFTLSIDGIVGDDPRLQQYDIDRWCIFLSRNGVEELNMHFFDYWRKYKLPFCILSCPTLKHLRLYGIHVDFPFNAGCVFPSVTSLVLEKVRVECSGNGIPTIIPNLEKLTFFGFCDGISKFEISAPKLKTVSVLIAYHLLDLRWLSLHLKAIKNLSLYGGFFWRDDVAAAIPTFPTATNLQAMKLYDLSFGCGKQITAAMLLLQKSPNLCELDIRVAQQCWNDDKKAAKRLLKNPNLCFLDQDMNMLETVKIAWFSGSKLQILFVKSILSKCPTLKRVVIQEYNNIKASAVMKFRRELSRFPRASPEAQLVWMEYNPRYCLVDYSIGDI